MENENWVWGEYYYYGKDPDGDRAYHNSKNNLFLSRAPLGSINADFKVWQVSLMVITF